MAIIQEYSKLEKELQENLFLPIERVLEIYRRMEEIDRAMKGGK